jgi:hypothetical protein
MEINETHFKDTLFSVRFKTGVTRYPQYGINTQPLYQK